MLKRIGHHTDEIMWGWGQSRKYDKKGKRKASVFGGRVWIGRRVVILLDWKRLNTWW